MLGTDVPDRQTEAIDTFQQMLERIGKSKQHGGKAKIADYMLI